MSTTTQSTPLTLDELRLKLDIAEKRWLKAKDLSPYEHEYMAARLEVLGYRGLLRALEARYRPFEFERETLATHTKYCIGCLSCWPEDEDET